MALELRPTVAPYNWHQLTWRNREISHIRGLAWHAGEHAYQGPGWSNREIEREADRFLHESLLLAALAEDPFVRRLVFQVFRIGWREHEANERRQQP